MVTQSPVPILHGPFSLRAASVSFDPTDAHLARASKPGDLEKRVQVVAPACAIVATLTNTGDECYVHQPKLLLDEDESIRSRLRREELPDFQYYNGATVSRR